MWRQATSETSRAPLPPRLSSSDVETQLTGCELQERELACPVCAANLSCQLPTGISGMQCEACEARFFAVVSLPKTEAPWKAAEEPHA